MPRLSSVAVQRQPVGHLGGGVPGPVAVHAGRPSILVPVSVHSGNHRLHHLAGAKPGPAGGDSARAGAHRPRGPGASGVQAQPPRRGRDRSRGRPRAEAFRRRLSRSGTSSRTATTSVNTVRRGSTWRSGACRARRTASIPSTTRPQTIWTLSSPASWRARTGPVSRS